LYDIDEYVTRPATIESQLSLVELMATSLQPVDFFVSHFWGEPTKHFVHCLEQHSEDRGLESKVGCSHGEVLQLHPGWLGGRSPNYWVCAFANRQHDIESEMGSDLGTSAFSKAMMSSSCLGTVSIVDYQGKCFGRIWCKYSLVRSTQGSVP